MKRSGKGSNHVIDSGKESDLFLPEVAGGTEKYSLPGQVGA